MYMYKYTRMLFMETYHVPGLLTSSAITNPIYTLIETRDVCHLVCIEPHKWTRTITRSWSLLCLQTSGFLRNMSTHIPTHGDQGHSQVGLGMLSGCRPCQTVMPSFWSLKYLNFFQLLVLTLRIIVPSCISTRSWSVARTEPGKAGTYLPSGKARGPRGALNQGLISSQPLGLPPKPLPRQGYSRSWIWDAITHCSTSWCQSHLKEQGGVKGSVRILELKRTRESKPGSP